MLVWYSQEAPRLRAASSCSARLDALLRARSERGRGRDSTLWGVFSALALATHYFAIFPVAAEAVWLLLRPRPAKSARALGIAAVAALLLAPLAIHQMISATPNGSPTTPSATGSGRRPRPSSPARPATSSPGTSEFAAGDRALRPGRGRASPALRPWGQGGPAGGGDPPGRRGGDRRGAGRARDRHARQGLRPGPQPDAGAGAAARRGGHRGDVAGRPAHRRRLGVALFAYSLGFCLCGRLADPATARLGRGRREARRAGTAPRAIVTWTLGEASLRYYLSTGSFQAAVGRLPLARPRSRLRLRRAGAARPPRSCRPGFRQTAYEARRPPLSCVATPSRSRPGARAAPRTARPDLNFRSTGVLMDGIGPG